MRVLASAYAQTRTSGRGLVVAFEIAKRGHPVWIITRRKMPIIRDHEGLIR